MKTHVVLQMARSQMYLTRVLLYRHRFSNKISEVADYLFSEYFEVLLQFRMLPINIYKSIFNSQPVHVSLCLLMRI